MDEKTEELRDIFLSVTDESTLTEHQRDDRGSLDTDRDVERELQDVISEMRERYTFETHLDESALIDLVQRFYEGATDDDLATALDVEPDEIIRARYDLHLTRADEHEVAFDRPSIIKAAAKGATPAELADRFEVDTATIKQQLRIHDVERRSRQVNQRFRDAFDTILADAELSKQMVRDVHEDGLDEATEGLETNVSF